MESKGNNELVRRVVRSRPVVSRFGGVMERPATDWNGGDWKGTERSGRDCKGNNQLARIRVRFPEVVSRLGGVSGQDGRGEDWTGGDRNGRDRKGPTTQLTGNRLSAGLCSAKGEDGTEMER